MSILITGGAGFIGSHLVDFLIENTEEKITVLDNFSRGLRGNLKTKLHNPRLRIVEGEITNKDLLIRIINEGDIVFHLAAQASVLGSVKNESLTFSSNVIGTFRLLEAAKKIGVKSIVFTSSREVYGDADRIPVIENSQLKPKNPYGISKVIGEMYCKYYSNAHGIDIRVLRLANVYGKRDFDRVIPLWINNVTEGKPIIIFGGDQIIDFIHVDTVVHCLWIAASKGKFDSPINIGSGVGIPIKFLANKIFELVSNKYCEINIVEKNNQEVSKFVADITKMKEYFQVDYDSDPLFGLQDLFTYSNQKSK